MDTIAITGVSGYFGRVLMPLLEADPAVKRIVGIDLVAPGEAQSWSKLDFRSMDIRDPRLEESIKGCDVLVHLAFQVMRLPYTRDIDDVNIRGTRAVYQAAARQGIRKLVLTSSVVAYGLHADNPIPLTEESPLRPNPGLYYGRAKAANEGFLDEFTRQHPEMVITRLRPCTVIGPQADPALMTSFYSPTAVLVKGYNPLYQLLHEDDLARALHVVIRTDAPGIFNVTSDDPCTLEELTHKRGGKVLILPLPMVRVILGILWRTGKSAFAPEWVDLSRYPIVASNARLKSLGWQPQYTTAQAYYSLLASRGIRFPGMDELMAEINSKN
jgi:nucleoside-diphosphate-sugar epimerase